MGQRDEWFEVNPDAAKELVRFTEEYIAGTASMGPSAFALRLQKEFGWHFGPPGGGPDTNFRQWFRARLGHPSPSRANGALRASLTPPEWRAQPGECLYTTPYRHCKYRRVAWWHAAKCIPLRNRAWALGLGLVESSLLDMQAARSYGLNFPDRFIAVERNKAAAAEIRSQGIQTFEGDLSDALNEERQPTVFLWDSTSGFIGDNLKIADRLASHPGLLAPGAVVIVNALHGRDGPLGRNHRGVQLCDRARGNLVYAWSYRSGKGSVMNAAVFTMPQ